MQKINVGLIGGGFMGKVHSLAYSGVPMFYWPSEFLPVKHTMAEATPELAADAANRFGFQYSTDDWRTVVENPDIDVVDIATPNHLHADVAIAALRAGKHVICEKPIARTVDEAKAMYEAAREAKVTNMVAFNYRRTPAVALAKGYIDEGAIGDILNVRATYLQDWSADPNAPLSWRFQKSIAGSGAVGDILTHVVDIARYLAGDITSVTAMTKTYIPERPIQSAGTDSLGELEDCNRAQGRRRRRRRSTDARQVRIGCNRLTGSHAKRMGTEQLHHCRSAWIRRIHLLQL